MILYRRGFGLFDQEKLAKYFNIKVSKDDAEAFNEKLNIYESSDKGGMKTTESENIINQFFKEEKIPLVAKSVKPSEINDLEEFIIDNLNKNNDLWMEYQTYKVHKKEKKKKWYIPEWMDDHDNVVEGIKKNTIGTKVLLVDPFWYNKPRTEADIKNVKDGLKGFIIISGK